MFARSHSIEKSLYRVALGRAENGATIMPQVSRSRLAKAARLFWLREPRYGYGRDQNPAASERGTGVSETDDPGYWEKSTIVCSEIFSKLIQRVPSAHGCKTR